MKEEDTVMLDKTTFAGATTQLLFHSGHKKEQRNALEESEIKNNSGGKSANSDI